MSAQVVVYTRRDDFKNLVEVECKSVTGFLPVVKESQDELKNFLKLISKIDLLIIDNDGSEADYSFLQMADIRTIFLLSKSEVKLPDTKVFICNSVDDLINNIKNLFSKEKAVFTEYISVPIDSFIHFKILPFDLYIKFSDDKFVKRIHANEDIDQNQISNLKSKGITDLHFERKFNREFSILLINNMINKVESEYSSHDDRLKAINEVFLTTQALVKSIGLAPRIIEVCESVMDKITTDITQNKDKFPYYLSDLRNKSALNFQFRLVKLTSLIATKLLETAVGSDKEEDIRTIVFASFFCDISLKDPAFLDYRDEASLKDLWPEDQKMILEHALRSSEIVSKYKNAPDKAAEIIKQHHGSETGIGFVERPGNNLLPHSLCLIVAEEIAYNLLKNPEKNDGDVLNELMKKYEKTPVSAYLELLCRSDLVRSTGIDL